MDNNMVCSLINYANHVGVLREVMGHTNRGHNMATKVKGQIA